MRRLTRSVLLVLVAGAVLLSACGDDASRTNAMVGGRALVDRKVDVGDVTVKVSPRRLDSRGATFGVVFDTHEGALDLDPADSAQLQIGGVAWARPRWQGDGPGGHHRSGELRFAPGGPVKGAIRLTINGLARPATVEWKV